MKYYLTSHYQLIDRGPIWFRIVLEKKITFANLSVCLGILEKSFYQKNIFWL